MSPPFSGMPFACRRIYRASAHGLETSQVDLRSIGVVTSSCCYRSCIWRAPLREDWRGLAIPSALVRFHLAGASSRLGEPYWVASKLAEFIFCGLFRGIAKQDIGGCEAFALGVRGVTVIWGHGDVEIGETSAKCSLVLYQDV